MHVLNAISSWIREARKPIQARRRAFRQLVIESLDVRLPLALDVQLIKDINAVPETPGSFPTNITRVGSSVFFSAGTKAAGDELWKTDGTEAGTVMVKDIFPGSSSSSPRYLTNVNGVVYFVASDAGSNSQLWKSDGTTAGTVKLSGTSSFYAAGLINVNGTLYFTAWDPAAGQELWKSDGTELGTVMVRDIKPGPYNSDPFGFVSVGGSVYFRANDGTHGHELWKTDGTLSGTVMVADIRPGSYGSFPSYLSNVGGSLYFAASDGTHGGEPWKSDGTLGGTAMVRDIRAGSAGSDPKSFTKSSGTVFFQANDGANGSELWKTDGTLGGTTMVADINSGSEGSFPIRLTDVNGKLYFAATDSEKGTELWTSNGVASGTERVKDINPGSGGAIPRMGSFTNIAGTFYFVANDGSTGYELWRSDGSSGGTTAVRDIRLGVASSFESELLYSMESLDEKLLFASNDGDRSVELWKSDGTGSGTEIVKDIRAHTNDSFPFSFTNTSGNIFFSATDGIHGFELWKSDGTTSGTELMRDIAPGAAWGIPSFQVPMANVNGTVFFQARDGDNNTELWKSNGTPDGTVLVKDINPGIGSSSPSSLTNFNGLLYFTAFEPTSGTELWKSDGTAEGTKRVKDIQPGVSGFGPGGYINVNGTLFFVANDGTTGFELWKTDGTETGTVMVKDINPGATGGYIRHLVAVNNTLFFVASEGTTGLELWKSDGSTAGTVLVKDIRPGVYGSSPASLANINGILYFEAFQDATGTEIWRSDGTEAGTVLLKDIRPGPASSSYGGSDGLGPISNVNGTLYFRASDGVHGTELWKSDGTTAGTVMVKDIRPGIGRSVPTYLTNFNGTLYFSANDGTDGFVLWRSDGTAAGTISMATLFPRTRVLEPTPLLPVGEALYFTTPSDQFGTELWKLIDNDPPSDIFLSPSTIPENSGANAAVGSLSTTDPDVPDEFTYTLVAGTGSTDNAEFTISGSVLRAINNLNYEARSSYSVRVRSTDRGGLFTEKAFAITVTDVSEAPVLTRTLSNVVGNVLSTFTNTGTWSDPEGDAVTLTASLGTIIKNADGTWSWSFVPTQAYNGETVIIKARDSNDNTSQVTFTVDALVAVVNSKVYYKGSSFAGSGVNAALDSSKVIAKSGTSAQTLTFANLVNNTRGINGLVFDVAGLASSSLTASDFKFRVSPTGAFMESTNPPGSWISPTAPSLINVTAGTSTTPARVRLEWTDNFIENRWLQIKILANSNTGLLAPQVFYIGHLLGETNGLIEGGAFRVRGTDVAPIVAAINPSLAVPVSNIFDLNKDGRVRGTDSSPAVSAVGLVLTRITIPPAGSTDEGEGDSGNAIVEESNETSAMMIPQLASNLTPISVDIHEIRARWTDEVFDCLAPSSNGPVVAQATSRAILSATEAVKEVEPEFQLLSLDDYFERLGRERSLGVRSKRS